MRDISGGWNALKPTYLQYFRMFYSETHSFEIEELSVITIFSFEGMSNLCRKVGKLRL